MEQRSTHYGDVAKWIEKVIDSCETYQQTFTAKKLITNFAKVLPIKEITLNEYLQRSQVICYSGTVYLHSNQLTIFDALKDITDMSLKDNDKYWRIKLEE